MPLKFLMQLKYTGREGEECRNGQVGLDGFWGVKGLGAERIAVLHLPDGSYQKTVDCRYDSGRKSLQGGIEGP